MKMKKFISQCKNLIFVDFGMIGVLITVKNEVKWNLSKFNALQFIFRES